MTNGMKVAKNNMYGEEQKEKKILSVPKVPKVDIDASLELRIFEEVKAAIFLAKQFPRDEGKAEDKILKLCKRDRFKDTALYSFERAGQIVEGPTIRFAEALARAWGNIQYSVIELETNNGNSKMLAYAWDVENNTKSTKQFDVSLTRYTKSGSRVLCSMQECYEMKAAYGARFLRGCILNLIPNDIIETAIEEVKNNITSDFENQLELNKKNVLEFMEKKLGVSLEDVENYLNLPYESWQAKDLTTLKLAYNGIREGQFTIEEMTGKKEVVTSITFDQIKELFELDKGKNKLFSLMWDLYRKTVMGKLTSKEYAELKNLLK